MAIYICITIWILVVNFFSKPVVIHDSKNEEGIIRQKASFKQVLLTIGVIIVVFGLRSEVADTVAYIIGFNRLPIGQEGLEYLKYFEGKGFLFQVIEIACKTLVNNYHFFFLIIALLSGGCIAHVLRNYSEYYSDSIALFMLTGTYVWMLNGIRQFLAVCITFWGLVFLDKRKVLKYFFLIIIAASIHRSAIIMLAVYFIVQGKAGNKKTVFFIAIGILSVLFLPRFISILDFLTEGTEYEGYTDQFSIDDGSNPIRTLIFAVPPVLALIRKKEVESIAPPYITIAINMSIVCVVFSLIANFTSGILMGALPIYFSVYNLILLPWLLRKVYSDIKAIRHIVYFYYTILFLIGSYPYYSDILFGGKIFPAW